MVPMSMIQMDTSLIGCPCFYNGDNDDLRKSFQNGKYREVLSVGDFVFDGMEWLVNALRLSNGQLYQFSLKDVIVERRFSDEERAFQMMGSPLCRKRWPAFVEQSAKSAFWKGTR